MRPTTHKTEDCLFAKLGGERTDSRRSPKRCVSDRFGSIATVSTTAVVTTRHDQCPVETTVGTEGTSTVAVAVKAYGRSTTTRHHLSEVTLAPQCSYAAVARRNRHRSQYVDSEERKFEDFFHSSLRHYQSAVLDVSSCSPWFPSTRVRIPGILEGDNIEHQLTIDSATDILCIAKTFIDNQEKIRHRIFSIPPC